VTAIANERESLLSFDGIDVEQPGLWAEAAGRAARGETHAGIQYTEGGLAAGADSCLELVTSHLIEVRIGGGGIGVRGGRSIWCMYGWVGVGGRALERGATPRARAREGGGRE
jgi:hypothetical protein